MTEPWTSWALSWGNALAKLRKHNYSGAFIIIVLFWFTIVGLSSTLYSGYHFTDDHEIVKITTELQHTRLAQVLRSEVTKDLRIRLRPFYYVHRVIESRLFGTHFLYWSLYTGMIAAFTAFFLFAFARIVGFAFDEALLFSFLSLVGKQAAIWWCLGPAETLGMFLLAACLVFLALSVYASKHRRAYGVVCLLLAVLMSLTKESFILVLPALAFLKAWLFHDKNGTSWWESAKAEYLSVSALVLVSVVEVLSVRYFIGTTGLGYAGVEGFRLIDYLKTAVVLARHGYSWVILLAFLGVVTINVLEGHLAGIVRFLKKLSYPLISTVLIALPQVVLYTKSGLDERYFLPGIVGFSLLAVSVLKILREESVILRNIVLVLLTASILLSSGIMFRSAQAFAAEGRSTSALFNIIEKKTAKTTPILIVVDPARNYEFSWSIKTYLENMSGRSNLYLSVIKKERLTAFEQQLASVPERWYGHRTLDTLRDKGSVNFIVIGPGLEEEFIRRSGGWFAPSSYERHVSGSLVTYSK